jgi:hypothetical protein
VEWRPLRSRASREDAWDFWESPACRVAKLDSSFSVGQAESPYSYKVDSVQMRESG